MERYVLNVKNTLFENKEEEAGVDQFTTSPNGQLGDISYQVPITLGSKELELLVHKVETLSPKNAATIA